MGRINTNPGGGGSADLDAITATAGDILKGKVSVDQEGELLTGTLELTGNAGTGDVLASKTFYSTDAKTKLTGTITTRTDSGNAALSAGGSKSYAAGYYPNAHGATANSLSSQTSATAAAGNILSGKTAWVNGSKVTGTMVNHTGTPQHINARRLNNNRFEVAVAAGYHGYSWDGNSYEYMEYSEVASTLGLTAAKLAKGQTVCGIAGTYTSDATATAAQILSGKTAYVNGSKITGTMAVSSVLSFSAASTGIRNVIFTWKNPAKGPFSGVIIVYKTGSYPTSITDGTRIYKGSGSSTTASGSSTATCTMPSESTTYYFRCYSYVTQNSAEWVASTTYTASATTSKTQYIFTSSGTFTVPAGISKISIFCVGGGGGGGGSRTRRDDNGQNSGAGGGGGYTYTGTFNVSSGINISITVGSGGSGGAAGATSSSNAEAGNGTNGGASSASGTGVSASASGGLGGRNAQNHTNYYAGGNGGSGGGGANLSGTSGTNRIGTTGGSDGGNGSNGRYGSGASYMYGGTGQGTTTRAFGESSGTLYAGGGAGGGCGYSAWDRTYDGTAGDGGGGSSMTTALPGAGSANTGGGGGGAGVSENDYSVCPGKKGGNGGTGIVLIKLL